MVKKITFHISSEGDVSLSVDGASGNSCETLTEPFEQVLGSVAAREYKDSYYQASEGTAETQSTGSGEGE